MGTSWRISTRPWSTGCRAEWARGAHRRLADLSFSSWPAALCLNGHAQWRRFYNGEREERWLKQEADGGGRVGKLRPTQLYYGEPTVRPTPFRARD